MKIQKCITLIGIVITIIVIIILAGVTISMVIGDNGVLSNAQNAAITGTQAREEEQVKTAAMAAMTISSINGNIGIEKQYFDEELKKEFGTGNYRLEEETDKFVTTILGTGNSYEIDKFGNIVGKIPSEGTNEDIVTNLLPGLYKSGSNYKVMLKNWDELVNEEIVVVSENGALSTPRSGATNYSAEALTGDLVVADTVTSLSKYAFYYCINMTNIILPESVISI